MSSLTAAIGENSIEPAKARRTSGMAPGQASHALFTRARELFPDGTARITIDRDPIPRYLACGEGAYVVDVDGNRFLDLNGNFTTLIHGHGFLPVVEAVTQQLRSGSCFANPTEAEIGLASLLRARLQRLEHLRFVNSGTEAVMFAIKAARAFTGRPAIAKIEGAYHGAYDWAEVAQGGTRETWGIRMLLLQSRHIAACRARYRMTLSPCASTMLTVLDDD
ncbi:aminotransferase class III-fold pyridoxal phosphate-dependent enzyme [Aliirhizobium terrae]|uniref:aminotransferase class III-fold pyridoxal phosphate-dependent enzyme n=1 Tax=Terrirhizobium terrae TaxID=2926709 RepID=UPI00336AB871